MTGSKKVAYISFVELNLNGSQIRLFKGLSFMIDGFGFIAPYNSQNGVKVNRVGGSLIVSSNFGLSINSSHAFPAATLGKRLQLFFGFFQLGNFMDCFR